MRDISSHFSRKGISDWFARYRDFPCHIINHNRPFPHHQLTESDAIGSLRRKPEDDKSEASEEDTRQSEDVSGEDQFTFDLQVEFDDGEVRVDVDVRHDAAVGCGKRMNDKQNV